MSAVVLSICIIEPMKITDPQYSLSIPVLVWSLSRNTRVYAVLSSSPRQIVIVLACACWTSRPGKEIVSAGVAPSDSGGATTEGRLIKE